MKFCSNRYGEGVVSLLNVKLEGAMKVCSNRYGEGVVSLLKPLVNLWQMTFEESLQTRWIRLYYPYWLHDQLRSRRRRKYVSI